MGLEPVELSQGLSSCLCKPQMCALENAQTAGGVSLEPVEDQGVALAKVYLRDNLSPQSC